MSTVFTGLHQYCHSYMFAGLAGVNECVSLERSRLSLVYECSFTALNQCRHSYMFAGLTGSNEYV